MIKCENCERTIGNLETVFEIDGHKVCDKCLGLLRQNTSGQDDPDKIQVEKGYITTERTGKNIKAGQAIGAVLSIIGVVVAFQGGDSKPIGIGVVFLGLVIFIVAGIKGWWEHG